MKELIYNYDNLTENDVTEVVVRTKALVINDDIIYIGNEKNVYQFPGGHLEENESLKECLKREVLEETGIEITDKEIVGPFIKITYLNKNWPSIGKNRKSDTYYYVVNTNKKPDLSKTNYTENEIKKEFKIEEFKIDEAIDLIRENIPNSSANEVISRDMIIAIEEYIYQLKNSII